MYLHKEVASDQGSDLHHWVHSPVLHSIYILSEDPTK